MAYCTPDDVRTITGLTSAEIGDTQLTSLISSATVQLNADIQIKWEDERVWYINNEKHNHVDGDNVTYYTKRYPIGDMLNSGTVNTYSIYAYTIKSGTGDRTDYAVDTIENSKQGKFTLSTAPSSTEYLYITYVTIPVPANPVHDLLKLAASQLAAALAFTRIDAKKVQSFRVGKVAVMKQSDAFRTYKLQYIDTINKIRNRMLTIAEGDKTL